MTFASGRRTARATGLGQQPVLLLLLIAGFLAAMGARLAWLQLAHGTENRILADMHFGVFHQWEYAGCSASISGVQ